MRIVLLFFCLCIAMPVIGQHKPLLYQVDDLPQSLLLNPGAPISFEKHIGIPLLSGISVSAGSSGLSVYDIFQEGGDFNARVRDAIFRLSDTDFFTVNEQLEIVSFGWKPKFKEIYYSVGVYQELDAIVYFPRDLAILAYEGNADYIDVPFEFNDLSVAAEALTVYHFGVNKQVSKKLRLGARAKLYSSIANVNSTNNSGQFITRTTPEGSNFYSHEIQNAQVIANTSGLFSLAEGEANLATRALLSKNFGIGVDVGGTYTINDKVTASASVLDVGAVFHGSDIRSYRLEGSYDLQGIEFQFPQVLDGTATTPYWENLEDEIDEQIPFDDALQTNYTSWRPVKVNGGINYGFGTNLYGDCDCTSSGKHRYASNVGLQFYAIKRPRAINSAVTAYFDKKWNRFFRTKLTYTADTFSKRNVGLLVSATLKRFNVYLAADNLLEYPNLAKTRNASLQLGFQLTFESE